VSRAVFLFVRSVASSVLCTAILAKSSLQNRGFKILESASIKNQVVLK
jgi:hypothetical protein